MEVYVIRHTPVAVGKELCYGQLDVPLAEHFMEDFEKYKNKLPTQYDAIYTSPSTRCHALAQHLDFGPVISEPGLMEMNFGEWEGQKWNEIDQKALNTWMMDFVNVKTPDGESLLELFQRVNFFLEALKRKNYEKVLLVTHAGVIRCIWAYLLEIPLKNIFKIPVGYFEVFTVKLHNSNKLSSIKRKQ